MPASAKKSSKPTTRPVKPRAKASSPSRQPFLRFYHSESLRAKTLDVLTTVEKAKDTRPHRDALANLVVELTDSGMDYFFLRPLKLAKAGFVTEQSARFGMAAATGMMASATRAIIGRMDQAQILTVCRYIRQLMK
jgi:hypothetical protein